MDFSNLYFRNVISFKSLPILRGLATAAKIYEFTSTIEDKSIKLVSNYDTIEELISGKSDGQILFELLSCGTKPLNAIAFMTVASHSNEKERVELRSKFDYEVAEGYVPGAFETASAVLASSYLMAVTRGTLPASSVQSARNPLPTFVMNMFKHVSPKTEKDLLTLAMDFDPKHIDLSVIFEDANLIDWPEEIANRLNLGVAGHKLLKACQILSDKFVKAKSKNLDLCEGLAKLGQEADGGFYPSLHPALNQLKNVFPKFYLYGLKALFDTLEGSKDNKYMLLKQVGAFNSDKLISGKELENIPNGYLNWDISVLLGLIGKPVKFQQYDAKKLVRKELIKHGDFDYIELKSKEKVVEETVELVEKTRTLGDSDVEGEKSSEKGGSTSTTSTKSISSKEKKGAKERFLSQNAPK